VLKAVAAFARKNGLGCNNAIFVLQNVIEYFNERGTNVYLASLDTSKAFAHVNHFQLYLTVMKQCIPVVFLNIIINWYSKLTIMVRWNTAFSDTLRICSGVRQGGVLSSHFLMFMQICLLIVLSQKRTTVILIDVVLLALCMLMI